VVFPNVDWCVTTPNNYQPRQPPILNEREQKLMVLCLPDDMKFKICQALHFMISDNPVDLLPAFSAFKLKLIPSKFVNPHLRHILIL